MRKTDLLALFGTVREDSDGYLVHCPAHNDSDPSLKIWFGDNGQARLTCRAGCDTADVIAKVGLKFSDLYNLSGDARTVPQEAARPAGVEELNALAGYVARTSDFYFTTEVGDDAKEYVRRRFGVDYELASELNLGADDGSDMTPLAYRSRTFRRYPRVTVPLCGFDGVPRGLQGRDLTGQCAARWVSLSNPEGQRWAPYGVFRGHGGWNTYVVTEGPGDALTACALGYDAVAIRGAALTHADTIRELVEGMRQADRIILAGDQDKAGRAFVTALSEGFRKHGITPYLLQLPAMTKDITDWRKASPETFPVAFHGAVQQARPAATEQQRTRVEVAKRTGAVSVTDDQGKSAADILSDLVTQYGESDAMNAYALVAWSEGTIRYAHGLGFYVWNGQVWQHSETKVRQMVHRMGAALVLAGKLSEARGFTMTTRIDALLTELRSVPSVLVGVEEFDAKPHLINFSNGTVDLRSGELRPHDKEDLLTASLAFDFDPSAACPRWDAFLWEIFPSDPGLVGYMQRLVGYGITGSTNEQCFAVLYGSGANGKSVLTDTLTSVFGAVTKTTRFATFEQRATGSIPNDIANLRGARLVMSSEGGAGKRMDEEGLKSLTGKDKVQARFLHKEWFEYRPTFLIMLATNHKPNFVSQDEGLWRRVKMIPFTRYFAPHERDYDLDQKLRAEAQGIAAWAVRGAVEWYASGLGDPESIRNSTKEFRETSDTLSGFYPGVIEDAPGESLNGTEAYLAYNDWCEEEGLRGSDVKTRTLFYRMMEERGVTKKRAAGGNVLANVRLAKGPGITGPGIFGRPKTDG